MNKARKKYLFPFQVMLCAVPLTMISSLVSAQEVVVVPLPGGSGNAQPWEVTKGKTFSSARAGGGRVGSLEVRQPLDTKIVSVRGVSFIFKKLPAGTFLMGSPDDETGREQGEDQHWVRLTRSFYMQTTEVTNAQWNAVIVDSGIGGNPSFGPNVGDLYPVQNLTWEEAVFFANALSGNQGLTPCYTLDNCTNSGVPGGGRGKPGEVMTCASVDRVSGCTGYRLPTESEWEYAARATTTTVYANPFSFDSTNTETGTGFNSNLDSMGWYAFHTTAYGAGAKPVARKQPNKWGLYDLHGNIQEWCQDWYDGYPPGTEENPAIDPEGPDSQNVWGHGRVSRGGNWNDDAAEARSAARGIEKPPPYNPLIGFRLVLPVNE